MSRQKPPDLTRTDGHMTESKSTSTTCPVYNTANKPNIVILLNQSFNIEKMHASKNLLQKNLSWQFSPIGSAGMNCDCN